MKLLKELLSTIKEDEMSFSRGAVEPAPAAAAGAEGGAPDTSMSGDSAAMGAPEEDQPSLCFDIPTFLRVMEWAREEAETDDEVHAVTEQLLALNKDCINMEDFEKVYADCCGQNKGTGDDMENSMTSMASGGDAPPQGGDGAPPANPKNEPFTGM